MKNYSRKTNQPKVRYRTPSRIRAQRQWQRYQTTLPKMKKVV